MDKPDAQDIRDALSLLGYEPRSYSGRGMYGKECVAVDVEWSSDEWTIGQALALRFGQTTPAPDSDSMGRGKILYWPQLEWVGPDREYDEDDDNQPA